MVTARIITHLRRVPDEKGFMIGSVLKLLGELNQILMKDITNQIKQSIAQAIKPNICLDSISETDWPEYDNRDPNKKIQRSERCEAKSDLDLKDRQREK